MTNSNLTIEQVSRRLYVVGHSFPIKDCLKSIGCKWDGERKQWWIGTAKRNELQQCIDRGVKSLDTQDGSNVKVVGRATYKGKCYYVVAEGFSKTSGKRYCKLCFRDGTGEFWVNDFDQLEITKRYRSARTITSLQAYANDVREAQASGNVCPECGRPMSDAQAHEDLEDGHLKHYRCCDIPA